MWKCPFSLIRKINICGTRRIFIFEIRAWELCTEHFWLSSTELPHLPTQRNVFMHGMSSLFAQQLCLLVPGQVISAHVCRRLLQPGTTSAQPSSGPSLCSCWSASYLSYSHTMKSLQHPDCINLSQELLLDSWGLWAVLCSKGIYSPCSSQLHGCFLRGCYWELQQFLWQYIRGKFSFDTVGKSLPIWHYILKGSQ